MNSTGDCWVDEVNLIGSGVPSLRIADGVGRAEGAPADRDCVDSKESERSVDHSENKSDKQQDATGSVCCFQDRPGSGFGLRAEDEVHQDRCEPNRAKLQGQGA